MSPQALALFRLQSWVAEYEMRGNVGEAAYWRRRLCEDAAHYIHCAVLP